VITGAQLNYVEMSFSRVPMFSACTEEELMRVARVTQLRSVPSDTDVIREGETGAREFFVIMRGDARVSRGGHDVGTLGAGDFFGELALFDPAPRNATVTATSDLALAVLSQPAFHDALAETAIRDNVLAGMARRLHDLDARY
jgi:CRP-like cAMP-binding protein